MNEPQWTEEKWIILDYIPIGAFVLRVDYVVLFWNAQLEAWTGLARERVVGTNLADLFPHLKAPKYSMRLESIFEGGPPTLFSSHLHQYIIPINGPDEKLRVQRTTVTAIPAADGQGHHALFCLEDVTDLTQRIQEYRLMRDQAVMEAKERARAEEALRQRNVELQASNAELDAFAHTVAHDLKGPLGNIVGFAEVLEEEHATMSPDDLCSGLRNIARGGRKMSNIIDELLLLSSVRKMEEVQIARLDMHGIVSDVLDRLAYLIRQHQAEVLLPDCWPSALGYAPWVEEVWVNYISNAVRYGGHPPRFSLGAADATGYDQAGQPMARFWVSDNGHGLTPEEQSRVFVPFVRIDMVRANGHGLGLSIVERIVNKLGGQVGLESEPGVGSRFWFTLPTSCV